MKVQAATNRAGAIPAEPSGPPPHTSTNLFCEQVEEKWSPAGPKYLMTLLTVVSSC